MANMEFSCLNFFSDVMFFGSPIVPMPRPPNPDKVTVREYLSALWDRNAPVFRELDVAALHLQLRTFRDAPPLVADVNLAGLIKDRRDELQPVDLTSAVSSLPHFTSTDVIHGVIVYPDYPIKRQDKDRWCGLSQGLSAAEYNQNKNVDLAQKLNTPSMYAHSNSGHRNALQSHIIYNHRGNYSAPSVAIFNKALATFIDTLESGSSPSANLPSDSCKLAWKLCAASADVYTSESEREQALRPHVDGLLAGFVREPQYDLAGRVGRPDSVVRFGSIVSLIEEWKLEVGLGGDVEIQIAIDYMKLISLNTYATIRGQTCCPCILLTFSGPLLQIYGAVFTEVAIIQPIGEPIRLYGAPPHEDRIARVAAAFIAIRTALEELRTYYTTATSGPDTVAPARFFPSPTPVDPSQQATLNGLKFTGYLDYDGRPSNDYSRALYTGTLGPQRVIIKFCSRYSHEAHKLLANHGLAPEIHLCINVRGGLKMIVMDRLEAPWRLLAAVYMDQPAISSETREAVRSAISQLHERDLVFGDLRRPNVFVHSEDAKKVMLVDFEFAGRDVSYPLGLNTSSISWIKGIEAGSKILKVHDTGMCDKL